MTIITLTSDFGLIDPYVGIMKGVILSIAPDVRLVDLTHESPRRTLPRPRTRCRRRSLLPGRHRPPGCRRPGRGRRAAAAARHDRPGGLCGPGQRPVLVRPARARGPGVGARPAGVLAAGAEPHLPRPRHLCAGGGAVGGGRTAAELGTPIADPVTACHRRARARRERRNHGVRHAHRPVRQPHHECARRVARAGPGGPARSAAPASVDPARPMPRLRPASSCCSSAAAAWPRWPCAKAARPSGWAWAAGRRCRFAESSLYNRPSGSRPPPQAARPEGLDHLERSWQWKRSSSRAGIDCPAT